MSHPFFERSKREAKVLMEAEARGLDTSKLDLSPQAVCLACMKSIHGNAMRCSSCKAVIYCSAQCQKTAWKKQVPGNPPHREACAGFKRDMERIPTVQGILKQFPWGRIESDGSFNDDLTRAMYNVLGSKGYGYWSQRGGPSTLDQKNQGGVKNPFKYDAMVASHFHHLDGCDLLQREHLTDETGWKLPSEHIPRLDFTFHPDKIPVLVTDFGEAVNNWDAWYRWRKIPKASIAALLMHYPLTVYHLLTESLEAASPTTGSPDERVGLTVHLLGAEVELNMLPLFSELALLLPYHDINLIVFGPSVQTLLKEARSHPESLAGECSTSLSTPIFTYDAPPECGSSTIYIYLADSPIWDLLKLPEELTSDPDAMIACNAGLTTYPEWSVPILCAHHMDLPFAATEYLEFLAVDQTKTIKAAVDGAECGCKLCSLRGGHVGARESYPISLNPFHRPGQRCISQFRLPNLENGFSIVLVKRDSESPGFETRLNELEGSEGKSPEEVMKMLSIG